MLTNYRGEFNPKLTYMAGDMFKATTTSGSGTFVVTANDVFSIQKADDIIPKCGDGIICLSGEFSATVYTSNGHLSYTDVVYCGNVTRSVNIYLTTAVATSLVIESSIPSTLIKCDADITLTTSTYGYNNGIITGVLDGGKRFRAITTNTIPYSGSYESFYLSFTFSQKIFAGGE
jgi:hypothetical protein|nr:MAG TPA: hypothetical protein [Caudoviricetes sp.]